MVKITTAAILLASVALSGCAPVISGVMNATVDENTIFEKTAKYFGVARENITISSVEKGALTTSYQVRHAGNIYNCSIYYGQVNCTQIGMPNAQEGIGATKSSGAVPSAPTPVTGSTPTMVAMTPAQVQIRLNQLGYPVGSTDRVFGKKSVEELKLFQKARGLPVSGKLDSATVSALQ